MARKMFFLLIWIKTVTVFLMFALLCVYYIHALLPLDMRPNYWIVLVLLVPGAVVPLLIWKCLRSGRKGWWMPVLFFVESVYTIVIAFLYFSEVMHDMALTYFRHHGRFGVADLDGGMSGYLINDTTLTVILFVPVLIAGAVHFILARRSGPAAGEGADP